MNSTLDIYKKNSAKDIAGIKLYQDMHAGNNTLFVKLIFKDGDIWTYHTSPNLDFNITHSPLSIAESYAMWVKEAIEQYDKRRAELFTET